VKAAPAHAFTVSRQRLVKGQLRVVKRIEGGEPILLGMVQPGEFVGEMSYINGENRSADVISDLSAELIEIPFDRLDRVLFQKPAWSKALMRTLSKRLKAANKQILDQS
jgi:CRP/FNR family cyclic AMP-dependent transcriptional regulator